MTVPAHCCVHVVNAFLVPMAGRGGSVPRRDPLSPVPRWSAPNLTFTYLNGVMSGVSYSVDSPRLT